MFHYDADRNGNLDCTKILEGRSLYYSHIGMVPDRPDPALFTADDIGPVDPNASFIKLIREKD